jgi:cardiolipin synthase
MNGKLLDAVADLLHIAPAPWLLGACEALRLTPPAASADEASKHLPPTNNANLALLMGEILRTAGGDMSWEALGWSLQMALETHQRQQLDQGIELLWSGPAPYGNVAARRIDQALYDAIANSQHEIVLVTFAAASIARLGDALLAAVHRGVKVKLILEFKGASEGQLSFDALTSFPIELKHLAEVYYWPTENRGRNSRGRVGKLHAKLAVIDGVVLVSSANLTDDAFSRNMELGCMVRDSDFVEKTTRYVTALIENETFRRFTQ